MYLSLAVIGIILQADLVIGIDFNSILGQRICWNTEQNNCDTDFIDAYPSLSKSSTNLTDADTHMLLYADDSKEPENLDKCAGRLPPNSKFNPENQVIVIIMPFTAGFCDVAVYREWVNQFQQRGRGESRFYNIIVIDYSWGNDLDYYTAILNGKIVARQVDVLLRNIQEQIGVPFVKLTLIGHSLGAQVAGFIGALFPIYRIIGVDPAGPGFAKHKTPLKDRLDPSDATIIEVYHCGAGHCLPFLGIDYEAGHFNFYINGGTVQKACYPQGLISILQGDLFYGFGTLLIPTICWHAICAYYFKDTINPETCQFVGVKCKSNLDFALGKCRSCGPTGENCLIMGFDTDKYVKEIPDTPQVYHVKTSLTCPFCDKQYLDLDGYRETYESSLQSGDTSIASSLGILK